MIPIECQNKTINNGMNIDYLVPIECQNKTINNVNSTVSSGVENVIKALAAGVLTGVLGAVVT